ncbi:MAG: nucleoside-diphosphate sugar epimerase/dehydratase [Thermodesulfobacteriota bacterium]
MADRAPADPRAEREEITDSVAGEERIIFRYRYVLKLFLQGFIFVLAFVGAYFLRFEFSIPTQYFPVITAAIPIVFLAKAAGFLAFGLFHGWWRYVTIRDVLPILGGCSLGSFLFWGATWFYYSRAAIPRSIYAIDWILTILLVLGVRYLIRFGRETLGRRYNENDRRVLIVGAGAAGQMILREIRENPSLGMVEVGFVDDDPGKRRARIDGVSVLGDHEDIVALCNVHRIDEIVIAIPSAPPSRLRHILDHCRETKARARILPGVGDLIDGKVSVRALRDVDLEDLLGRDPVQLDAELLKRSITGHTVMVTGAAGSIGSELCRQLARLSPARLVLFEIAESPLFDIEMELRAKFPTLDLLPMIGDVRDRGRVREVLREYRPSIIYHAAAYKHVPVMEMHPVEAVKTNVMGTRILAETAAEFGVERFVLVSTDKAVRPTNVMGATKRVAELVIHNMNGSGNSTIFIAVRFGNVLGSVGSVVPIFRRQLETTGKLTVTHSEASRYFMLIPEAAGLILQAGAMGQGGEIFVLDMGEPVKIVDLAKNLIRLSGKELGVDAEIVFTGLRPGEKLHEELIIEGEDVCRTSHPKVMKLIGSEVMPPSWQRLLGELDELARLGDRFGVVGKLDTLVKGYTPAYEFHNQRTGFPAEDPRPAAVLSTSKSVH